MKRLISIIMLCVAIGFQLFSQNKVCDKVFNSYADTEGLLTFNLSGSLLSDIFSDEGKNDDFKISSVKILVVEDSTLNASMNLYDEVVPKLNQHEFEKIMSVKGKDKELVMLCKKQKNKIKEFILVSGKNDNILVYINGSLSLSNVKKVTKELTNTDKFEELEEANQN